MKQYNNLKEINHDLKRLSLERQIAWEEMKGLKEDFKESLQPYIGLGQYYLQLKNTAFSI